MDFDRIIHVIAICAPVFGVIGLGKLLDMKGILDDKARHFVNWLVFNISLPSLIYLGIASQDYRKLGQLSMFASTLGPIVIMIACAALFCKLRKISGGLAAAIVFGTFFSNVTYLGFPLCRSAFGIEGLNQAAIYNAIAMPGFVALAYLLIGLYGANPGESMGAAMKRALINPIIIASVMGILTAVVLGLFRTPENSLEMPYMVLKSGEVIAGFLRMIGSMGLPLALLMIGSSLRLGSVSGRTGELISLIFIKLAVYPAISLLFFKLFFPDIGSTADGAIIEGVTVLENAMPEAVAAYVISRQIGVEEGFVSALVVFSTIASVVTLPVWLYILIE